MSENCRVNREFRAGRGKCNVCELYAKWYDKINTRVYIMGVIVIFYEKYKVFVQSKSRARV